MVRRYSSLKFKNYTTWSTPWILISINRTMLTILKYNRAFTNNETVHTPLILVNNNKYLVIYIIFNFIIIQNKIDQDESTNHPFSFLQYSSWSACNTRPTLGRFVSWKLVLVGIFCVGLLNLCPVLCSAQVRTILKISSQRYISLQAQR